MPRTFRNISFATAASFEEILARGAAVTVRGRKTLELRNRVTTLAAPMERCLFLPGRNHDVFAQVAETMWVVGGRNDLPWLTRYLQRAPEFSDDGGTTWHGAYGPRLRSWGHGIDQLDEWRRLLIDDPTTRRAAGVLFDPARDYIPASKDIPCNNWLSWLLRDGRLHMSVAIRSNDAMWGFSGVNAFEWSVVHEMLALWVGAAVGDATYFASSYHLYDEHDHITRAKRVVQSFYGLSPYDFGIQRPAFVTAWDHFPEALKEWFAAEEAMRADPDAPLPEIAAKRDPLLHAMLQVLRLKWGSRGWPEDRIKVELGALPENDFTAAAYERLGRQHAALLEGIPQPKIAAFFSACRSATATDAASLKEAIKHLHARKNRSYAGAWKRRGERVSILPNIARKVDRLDAFLTTGATMEGETVLDTAVDLLVYAIKYVLFLAEQGPADQRPAQGRQPLSDFDENFDAVLDQLTTAPAGTNMRTVIAPVLTEFEQLWRAVDSGADVADRTLKAADLMQLAWELVVAIANAFPAQTSDFIRSETAR